PPTSRSKSSEPSRPPRWKKYSFASSPAMKPKPRSDTTFLMVPVVMWTSNFPNRDGMTHGPSEKGFDHAKCRGEWLRGRDDSTFVRALPGGVPRSGGSRTYDNTS